MFSALLRGMPLRLPRNRDISRYVLVQHKIRLPRVRVLGEKPLQGDHPVAATVQQRDGSGLRSLLRRSLPTGSAR